MCIRIINVLFLFLYIYIYISVRLVSASYVILYCENNYSIQNMFKSNVLPISLQLIDLILELFLQCGILDFVFILYIPVEQLTTHFFSIS